jgi:hypothetical protein
MVFDNLRPLSQAEIDELLVVFADESAPISVLLVMENPDPRPRRERRRK